MKWALLVTPLLTLSSLVGASPITRDQELTILANNELDVLKEHANYASAAYCQQAKLVDWSCGTRCLGQLNVTSYFSDDGSGIAGYLGFSKAEKKIVISFRGSSNRSNWFKNMAVFHNTFIYPTANEHVKVHSGFYESYRSVERYVRGGLKQVLTLLKNEPEPYKLVITGHSLGGAIATFCAMDIKRFYLNPESERCFQEELLIIDRSQIYLHTFGQPRAGNVNFAQLVYDTFGKNTTRQSLARVTNKNDPVSRLPPSHWGYLHHPHEIYIRKDKNTVACEDVAGGKVKEDENCIAGVTIPIGISAHSNFWGIPFGSGC